MIACSGVVWSRTTQSGFLSFGIGFAVGGPAMALENLLPVAFAPTLKEEPYFRASSVEAKDERKGRTTYK